jgi:hypothetical protein
MIGGALLVMKNKDWKGFSGRVVLITEQNSTVSEKTEFAVRIVSFKNCIGLQHGFS